MEGNSHNERWRAKLIWVGEEGHHGYVDSTIGFEETMHTRGPKTRDGIGQSVIAKRDRWARAPGVPLWVKRPKVGTSKSQHFEGGLVKVKTV